MICRSVSVARDKLVEVGMACPDSFNGCTDQEIRRIELHYAIHLPQCYRNFLVQMGHCAGEFLAGFDYSFPKMLEFRNWAEELVQQCESSFLLPTSAYVFFFDPAGAFAYFLCDGNPDPPIFSFVETEPSPQMIFDSFSNWLLAMVEDHISIWSERQRPGKGNITDI